MSAGPAPDRVLEPSARFPVELERLQAGLARQARLATLGEIAALIAHEYNNLLTPVLSYAQMALDRPDDAALSRKALERAAAGAERAAQISRAILGFLRPEDLRHAEGVERADALTPPGSPAGAALSDRPPTASSGGMLPGPMALTIPPKAQGTSTLPSDAPAASGAGIRPQHVASAGMPTMRATPGGRANAAAEASGRGGGPGAIQPGDVPRGTPASPAADAGRREPRTRSEANAAAPATTGPSSLHATHVRAALEAALTCLARDLAKDGIRLHVDIADVPPPVAAMPAVALQHVLLNLILNARRALLAPRPSPAPSSPASVAPHAAGSAGGRRRGSGSVPRADVIHGVRVGGDGGGGVEAVLGAVESPPERRLTIRARVALAQPIAPRGPDCAVAERSTGNPGDVPQRALPPGWVVVEIADSGCGMRPDQLASLFGSSASPPTALATSSRAGGRRSGGKRASPADALAARAAHEHEAAWLSTAGLGLVLCRRLIDDAHRPYDAALIAAAKRAVASTTGGPSAGGAGVMSSGVASSTSARRSPAAAPARRGRRVREPAASDAVAAESPLPPRLWCRSSPDAGTTFTLVVPMA